MKTQIENTPVICESALVKPCAPTAGEPADLAIFLELGSIGAGHAATSLSEILQQQVLIDIPKIQRIPPHKIPQFYRKHEDPTTAIYMQLAEAECDILLTFDVNEAKKIAALMTMAPSIEDLDPAMEASAIEELANILIGSFLSAISDFTGISLLPTTPQRIVDTFDAIIDHFLCKQSTICNEVLVLDTVFKRAGANGKSLFVIFPSQELQDLLVQKSKELMGT
jgi:chemotaxis protein CheC